MKLKKSKSSKIVKPKVKINHFRNKKKPPKDNSHKTKEELIAERDERREKRKSFYIDPDEFVKEIKNYYKTEKMTNEIGVMINNIAVKLSFSPNFINYTFKDQMQGDAVIKMFTALKNKKFDCSRGYSPFSYFTKIAFNAFRNRIKKEQKQRETLKSYQEDTYDALLQVGIDINKENPQQNNEGNVNNV
jgi:hypothetical protein